MRAELRSEIVSGLQELARKAAANGAEVRLLMRRDEIEEDCGDHCDQMHVRPGDFHYELRVSAKP